MKKMSMSDQIENNASNVLKMILLQAVTGLKMKPSEFEIIKGYKKYKLFDVTKVISVLQAFRLIQQSLSRTRC